VNAQTAPADAPAAATTAPDAQAGPVATPVEGVPAAVAAESTPAADAPAGANPHTAEAPYPK
jgi:hypothetical protein